MGPSIILMPTHYKSWRVVLALSGEVRNFLGFTFHTVEGLGLKLTRLLARIIASLMYAWHMLGCQPSTLSYIPMFWLRAYTDPKKIHEKLQ
jgi:hypothetical protein